MIRLLTGTLIDKDLEIAVIDVAGVGYEVAMPMPDLASLGALGDRCSVHVLTYVREDSLRLFGFKQPSGRAAFEKLIAVSGVGPKMALALLSGLDDGALARAIEDKDLARLSKIPGVGKKTAERLCLELRGKLQAPLGSAVTTSEAINGDLVRALESLGYRLQQAEQVAESLKDLVASGASLENLVREALRRMSSGKK